MKYGTCELQENTESGNKLSEFSSTVKIHAEFHAFHKMLPKDHSLTVLKFLDSSCTVSVMKSLDLLLCRMVRVIKMVLAIVVVKVMR